MEQRNSEFIKTYLSAIQEGKAAIFAGAGLSVGSGFVNWKELMREIASEIGLDVDKETDLIEVAQYYKNENGGRGKIHQKLVDMFSRNISASENHNLLANLPIRTYWTTNYDKLIESALIENNKIVDVKLTASNFTTDIKGRDAVVYKMHGDIQNLEDAVIIKEDYEEYNVKRQIFTTLLEGDLTNKTFLFWGFSFDDPNLKNVLSRMRMAFEKSGKDHYCFVKKVSKSEFSGENQEENEEKYQYACKKQQLKINDLLRYHIHALLVDDYQEMTDIFKEIAIRMNENNVFISGAAHTYGIWEKEAELFVYELAKTLAEQKSKVVSGFGLGIGSSVVNGILSYVYSAKGAKIDDCLVVHPFPQNIADAQKRKERWTTYRKDMLSKVGIALFMFGNKLVNGEIIDSDGMMEEFELAVKNGAVIIPLGCTGYAAKAIWDLVMKDTEKYYGTNEPLIKAIEELGDVQPKDYITLKKIILNTVQKIRNSERMRIVKIESKV
jgi:hypothetical protein